MLCSWTFLVGLCKLYPLQKENMWWLSWTGPPSPPPQLPHPNSSLHLSAVLCSFAGALHPSVRPPLEIFPFLSLQVFFLILLLISFPVFISCLSIFPLRSRQNNSSLIWCSHQPSLHHFNPLLLCLYISLPPHSYATFCCVWRTHLACGRLASDSYIN